MWSWVHKLGSPPRCYRLTKQLAPWFGCVALLLFLAGLYMGLVLAPADYQQGNAFRIMYIHVPSAIWAMGIYAVMSLSVIVFLIWKIKVADMVAQVSAPIGAVFALFTH